MPWYYRPLRKRLIGWRGRAKPGLRDSVEFVWINPETKTPVHKLLVDPTSGEVERAGDLFSAETEFLEASQLAAPDPHAAPPPEPEPDEPAPTVTELHERLAARGEVAPETDPTLDPVLENLRKTGRYRPRKPLL